MRKMPPLFVMLAAVAFAAPALATHWEDLTGTADCEGWNMTGMIIVGSQGFEVSFTCICDGDDECTYTPGYWKNHLDAWPVFDFAVGGVDYTQAELDEILGRPVRGDATIILAHHGLGSRPHGALKNEALAIKDELADFNELECEEDDSGEPDSMMMMKSAPVVQEAANWGTIKSTYR